MVLKENRRIVRIFHPMSIGCVNPALYVAKTRATQARNFDHIQSVYREVVGVKHASSSWGAEGPSPE